MSVILSLTQIPDNKDFFSEDPLEKQYVYLQAEFPSKVLEKVVLVSFQSGYMFIQTDKSIYTPGTKVLYRIFSLTPDLQPLDKSGGIYVEIINPQGITVDSETFKLKDGTKTHSYVIPGIAKSGIWTVATRYKNTPQRNFTAEFEVKEYVLPSFEVTLKPSKPFFYVDDKKLKVDITAKYLFGKDVNGVAFVVFGVKSEDTKTSLPASLKRVQIIDGEGRAELTKEMILRSFPEINQLVGSFLYISVSVITETGSEIVEAQEGGIQIVTSPYTIQFKRTPMFFHPGMSFDVTVYVTNPDQSPAENVDILIQPGEVKARTKTNGMAKAIVNTQGRDKQLHITARTLAQGIPDERQAVNQMTAQPYATKDGSGNYLHLSVNAAELEIGDQLNIDVIFKTAVPNQDVTYLILSKGQIVQGHKFLRTGNLAATLSLPVTKDLLPSFRVVAYYHVGSSEVVSDSIWVDVKDTCMGTLTLSVKKRKKNIFMPGDEFQLIVDGDPKAKVSLVAVDKAVFVLNKNKLTQTKIWDIIEKHDTGCTAGSGKDSMEVFYDAGLLFESDKLGGTNERTGHAKCAYFLYAQKVLNIDSIQPHTILVHPGLSATTVPLVGRNIKYTNGEVWESAHVHLQRAVHSATPGTPHIKQENLSGYPQRTYGSSSHKESYSPFHIIRQINPVTYRLELPADYHISLSYHVSLLKPANMCSPADSHIMPPLPIAVDGTMACVVHTILDTSRRRGQLQ
ncbi:complement C3-like, partial [Tachysurus ichikawai]